VILSTACDPSIILPEDRERNDPWLRDRKRGRGRRDQRSRERRWIERRDRFRMVKEENIPTLVLPNLFNSFSSDYTDHWGPPHTKRQSIFIFQNLKLAHQFVTILKLTKWSKEKIIIDINFLLYLVAFYMGSDYDLYITPNFLTHTIGFGQCILWYHYC